jgi:hypothetical protein
MLNILRKDSKAGAGPASADAGARQGRAAICVTTQMERLTESFPAHSIRARSHHDEVACDRILFATAKV